ncbi:MAG: matrixin family metalloprotease [Blastocatellia bacterium]
MFPRSSSTFSSVRHIASMAMVIVFIAITASVATATSLMKVSLAEQTRASGAIVRGRVTDVRTRAIDSGIVYTYAEFSVVAVLRGAELIDPARPLVVRQIGGATESTAFLVEGAARYFIGQEYLLFLVPDYEGDEPGWFTYGMHLGVYSVECDGVGEITRYVRQQGDGSHIVEKGRAADGDLISPAELDAVITSVPASDDPAVPQTPEYFEAARSIRDQVLPAYTIWDPPSRWTRPDRGEPLYFFWNPYGFPNGGATFLAALEEACEGWTAIPGSPLAMEVIDDTYICGLNIPNSNSEIAMDCKNEIQGKGCRSGILALAAIHPSGTHEYRGQRYRTIVTADIVLQDFDTANPCPEYLSQSTLQGVLAHELGHTIGLAHSTERTATMYGSFHSGMSSLEADDRAGCLFLYAEEDGPPVVESVTPELGEQNADSVEVTIAGARLTDGGDPTVRFGEGVTVKRIVAASEDEVTVEVSIAKKARLGPREVTVETGLGESNGAVFEIVKLIAPTEIHQFAATGAAGIAWTDPSAVNTHAEVWRRVGSGDWVLMETVVNGVMATRDRDVDAGRTYVYRVRNLKKAKKARKNVYSEWSGELTVNR